MAYKVLIPQDIAEEGKKFLRDRGYEIKMGTGATASAIAKDVVDCDAILLRTAPLPAEVIEAGRKLKVVARHGVGFDNIDVSKATEHGVWVTFAPESNASTVAEHTIGCILALARNFLRCDKELRAGNWEVRNQLTGMDLEGKVLGIVGLGKIGRRVAKKAALGLDMKVAAYDPYLKTAQFPEYVRTAESWQEVFRLSDFVTLHLPSTARTKGIVGRKEFGLMKPTAYLINAARGEIVNEPELIEALRNKALAGAALDVFEREPPAEDNELLALENVLLTPHNAALTRECMIRMALHAAQGIDEVLSGRQPTWPVNKPAVV